MHFVLHSVVVVFLSYLSAEQPSQQGAIVGTMPSTCQPWLQEEREKTRRAEGQLEQLTASLAAEKDTCTALLGERAALTRLQAELAERCSLLELQVDPFLPIDHYKIVSESHQLSKVLLALTDALSILHDSRTVLVVAPPRLKLYRNLFAFQVSRNRRTPLDLLIHPLGKQVERTIDMQALMLGGIQQPAEDDDELSDLDGGSDLTTPTSI